MNRIVLGLVVAAALVMVTGTTQAQEHYRGGGSSYHRSVSRGNGPGYSYRSAYTHRNYSQPRVNYNIPPAYYRPNYGPSCNYGNRNYGYGGGSYYQGYNSYYRGYNSGFGFSSGGLNIYYGF